MKGHEEIIHVRSLGHMPEWVFINDYPCATNWQLFNDFATVCVDGDNIRRLDMRFLVGCKVSIASHSERRAKALLEACKPYAVTIAAGVIDDKPLSQQKGWTEIWQK